MKINKNIGTRMKEYEEVTKYRIIPHMPTILRLDGKAFHTFTKNMIRPYDSELHKAMCYATEETMRNVIQNSVLSYTQSDEISVLLTDFPNLNTEQWFAGIIQKICSISASSVTAYFNEYIRDAKPNHEFNTWALFDCRVYQLPKEEICNYFIWRQQDATRNSIQMLGQSQFSHKELHKKSCNNIQQMLIEQKNINWNDINIWKKRGSCCYKMECGTLVVDDSPPIFQQDREFINKFLNIELEF